MSTPVLVRPPQPLAVHAADGHPALTPMAFVQTIVQAYADRGLSADGALNKAQIAPQSVSDNDGRITAMQMEALSDAAMRELDDEALGWFGRRLPWGSYGMLARASISSGTLGLALARWCRHHGLLADDITLLLHTHGDMAELDAHLHYRMVDVSSIKELARRWYPRVYFNAPKKGGGHRALADILESVQELRYYRAAILVPQPGPSSAQASAISTSLTQP